jgi:hypothetical protein
MASKKTKKPAPKPRRSRAKRPCGNELTGKSLVQSLMFSKTTQPKGKPPWTPRTIKPWAREHGYVAPHVEETVNTYRVRQFEPHSKGRGACAYGTVPFGRGTGIRGVLEFPRKRVESAVSKRMARG